MRWVLGAFLALIAGQSAPAAELTPQVVTFLERQRVLAVITETGGRFSHGAVLARSFGFPCVVGLSNLLSRLEQGMREIADAVGIPLLAYLKDENNFGSDKEAGLDAVARLIDSGVCVGIKYAVVRDDPSQDKYLESLLRRVDRSKVISGIGERPAICHVRDFKLNGFTTGSGCVAPRLSNDIFEACCRGEYDAAERINAVFDHLSDAEFGDTRIHVLWGILRCRK